MVDKIENVLMKRDGMRLKEARELICEAREEALIRLGDGDMPYDICEEWFGLEPDYLDELLF